MSSDFVAQKTDLLQQFTAPYTLNNITSSNSIDVGIRKLLEEINETETLVARSSCAGRIVVYLAGGSLAYPHSNLDDHARISGASISAEHDGGQSLFVSHDPLPLPGKGPVAPMLGLSDHTNLGVPPAIEGVRWVRCKFEPMVGNTFVSCFLSLLCEFLCSISVCSRALLDLLRTKRQPQIN